MCPAVPVRGWWVQCGKSGQEVSISHLSRPLAWPLTSLSAPAVCSVLQTHALEEQRSVVITHLHTGTHTRTPAKLGKWEVCSR